MRRSWLYIINDCMAPWGSELELAENFLESYSFAAKLEYVLSIPLAGDYVRVVIRARLQKPKPRVTASVAR